MSRVPVSNLETLSQKNLNGLPDKNFNDVLMINGSKLSGSFARPVLGNSSPTTSNTLTNSNSISTPTSPSGLSSQPVRPGMLSRDSAFVDMSTKSKSKIIVFEDTSSSEEESSEENRMDDPDTAEMEQWSITEAASPGKDIISPTQSQRVLHKNSSGDLELTMSVSITQATPPKSFLTNDKVISQVSMLFQSPSIPPGPPPGQPSSPLSSPITTPRGSLSLSTLPQPLPGPPPGPPPTTPPPTPPHSGIVSFQSLQQLSSSTNLPPGPPPGPPPYSPFSTPTSSPRNSVSVPPPPPTQSPPSSLNSSPELNRRNIFDLQRSTSTSNSQEQEQDQYAIEEDKPQYFKPVNTLVSTSTRSLFREKLQNQHKLTKIINQYQSYTFSNLPQKEHK